MRESLNIEKQWKLEIKFMDGSLLVIPDFEVDEKFPTLHDMLAECKNSDGFFVDTCPNGDYHIAIDSIMYCVYSFSHERV